MSVLADQFVDRDPLGGLTEILKPAPNFCQACAITFWSVRDASPSHRENSESIVKVWCIQHHFQNFRPVEIHREVFGICLSCFRQFVCSAKWKALSTLTQPAAESQKLRYGKVIQITNCVDVTQLSRFFPRKYWYDYHDNCCGEVFFFCVNTTELSSCSIDSWNQEKAQLDLDLYDQRATVMKIFNLPLTELLSGCVIFWKFKVEKNSFRNVLKTVNPIEKSVCPGHRVNRWAWPEMKVGDDPKHYGFDWNEKQSWGLSTTWCILICSENANNRKLFLMNPHPWPTIGSRAQNNDPSSTTVFGMGLTRHLISWRHCLDRSTHRLLDWNAAPTWLVSWFSWGLVWRSWRLLTFGFLWQPDAWMSSYQLEGHVPLSQLHPGVTQLAFQNIVCQSVCTCLAQLQKVSIPSGLSILKQHPNLAQLSGVDVLPWSAPFLLRKYFRMLIPVAAWKSALQRLLYEIAEKLHKEHLWDWFLVNKSAMWFSLTHDRRTQNISLRNHRQLVSSAKRRLIRGSIFKFWLHHDFSSQNLNLFFFLSTLFLDHPEQPFYLFWSSDIYPVITKMRSKV